MLKITLFTNILAIVFASGHIQFETVFEWEYMEYNWLSTYHMMEALRNGTYIPKNNILIGLKLWKNKIYLTIPRLKNGVPVTLAVTSATPPVGNIAPKLDPYPSWEMQTEGNCNAFQFVQSMEIDPIGRMWIIDTGRTQTSNDNPLTICSPRLIILDLENNGSIIHTYVFPDEVAPVNTVILNDIVFDHEDGGMAYITDSQKVDPGIIVYSLRENASWKVRNNRSMRIQSDAVKLKVAGTSVFMSSSVDGIALSPPGPNRLLYYSPFSSFYLYSIPVAVLKKPLSRNIDKEVTLVGRRRSQTGGMVMSNQGVLYFGLMNNDSIAAWDSKNNSSFTEDTKIIFTDHVRSQWPDTFSIDENGQLWFSTNGQQNFIVGNIDINRPNFRVLKGTIYAKNYQYLKNGTAPTLNAIFNSKSNANSIGTKWNFMTHAISFTIFCGARLVS